MIQSTENDNTFIPPQYNNPEQPVDTNIQDPYKEQTLQSMCVIVRNELAGALLFNTLYTLASGVGTITFQEFSDREAQNCLKRARDCTKTAIILFGANAVSVIPKYPCPDTMKTIVSISDMVKALETAYNWSIGLRKNYCSLNYLLQKEHPDIGNLQLSHSSDILNLFYQLQSMLS